MAKLTVISGSPTAGEDGVELLHVLLDNTEPIQRRTWLLADLAYLAPV